MTTRSLVLLSFTAFVTVSLLTGCDSDPLSKGSPAASSSPTSFDALGAATPACLAVDGAAHAELAPDIGAQFDAQASDREDAAHLATEASNADDRYANLTATMSTLATQTRKIATDYENDPQAFAGDALGDGNGPGNYAVTLTAARDACMALDLPTR